MKRGFTLVELSIVLVIIGLLIGGLLVAQSMVKAAQISGILRQLSQYDVAVGNFQTKYGQLPGDSTLLGHGGNNDGIIGSYFSGAPTGAESGYFWEELSEGVGLYNSKSTPYQGFNTAATGQISDTTCPKFNISQDKRDVPCLLATTYNPAGTGDDNYYMYFDPINGEVDAFGAGIYFPIRPVDAMALDVKADDGYPRQGKIVSGSSVYGTCYTNLTAPISYMPQNDGYYCFMFFIIGGFTGTK